MSRKYLEQIGVTSRPDNWCEDDKRQKEWEEDRQKYGFDERELWNMDFAFRLWLYERLKAFQEIAPVNLKHGVIKIQGVKYTIEGAVNYLIELLKDSFADDLWSYHDHPKYKEVYKTWAKISPFLGW